MEIPPNVIFFPDAIELQAAAAAAIPQACTHAVVMGFASERDSSEVAALLKASVEHPAALIIGHRGGLRPKLILLFFRLETGLRITSISGPRVYPLRLIPVINPTGHWRFSDTEILVRAAWAGCPIVEIALPDPGGAPSPRITWRELATHIRLIAQALSGRSHPKYDAGVVPPPRQSFWPRVWRWLNPIIAWRELRQGGVSRNDMAVGLAIGAFIGNMPAWGFHTALSLYVAKRLHLNPLAVMTGSHASAPPMGPVLVASAMWIGHVILHHERPRWENITPFHGQFWAHAVPLLLDWTLGAVIVGTALAIVTYLVANFLFRFVERPVVVPNRADAVGDTRAESATSDMVLPRI